MVKDNIFLLVILHFTFYQIGDCELQELMKSVLIRTQEWKEVISQQEILISNQTKIIEDQKELIFTSNQTRLLHEHALKLEQLEVNVTELEVNVTGTVKQFKYLRVISQRYWLDNVCKIAYQWLDNTFLHSHCVLSIEVSWLLGF